MKKQMRGLVKEIAGPSGLVYHDDLPVPEIGDDEVLIKVHCTAICGSDIHILDWDAWSEKRIKPPVTLGHEVAGDIVAVGKNVKDRKCGDRPPSAQSVRSHSPAQFSQPHPPLPRHARPHPSAQTCTPPHKAGHRPTGTCSQSGFWCIRQTRRSAFWTGTRGPKKESNRP